MQTGYTSTTRQATRHIPVLVLAITALTLHSAPIPEGYKLDGRALPYSVSARELDLRDEVTLEAWVRADAMDEAGGRILDKSQPGTQLGYMLDTHPGNSLRFLNAKGMCRYPAKLGSERWTHVAGVYSAPGRVMKLYLDGREVAKLDQGEFPPMSSSRVPLVVGADPNGENRFKGRVLRATVYGRALTAEEVALRAKATEPAPLAGVLGEWVFSAEPGRTIQPVAGKLVLRQIAARSAPVTIPEFAGTFTEEPVGPDAPLALWYLRPARQWTEALPIGNGRMGAMIFGGVTTERIQFNEHTVWNGRPHSYAHEGAVKALPEIRRLLQEGRAAERTALKLDPAPSSAEVREALSQARALQRKAQDLATREFMSIPLTQKEYQPVGDLWLDFPGATEVYEYRRWLDLDQAECVTEYRIGGVKFRRELFASYPDRAVVARVTASKPGALSCTLRLSSPHPGSSVDTASDRLVLRGQVEPEGVRFEAVAHVKTEGGELVTTSDVLRVTNATALTVRLVAASNFRNFRDLGADPAASCAEVLAGSQAKTLAQIREDHRRDHQTLFRRVALDLGRTPAAAKPTDVRLAEFSGGNDPQLAALTFQYGRYLLIASSRAGGQPANLQGIWNDSRNPAWGSKYTVNINTEMNYWPALPGNLAECQEPLFAALEDMVVSGRETAKAHYGARGWVLHHNFDLWRGTAPINASDHGIWVTGGAWLCEQLWEHYLFTGDRDFLARRAYPILKEASEFFVDYLVKDELTGWLISGPSNSPEQGGLVMGPTMDHQIVRSLLANTAAAARVLGRDAEFANKLDAIRKQIAPNLVGRHGQLQEWLEDKDDPKNQHRHVSHLWGVYPGADITWQDERLFKAARQSLIFRGDAATGWSMGWKVNLWARFLDGDHAYVILSNLLQPIGKVRGQGGMYPNLFDAHPPFQIDGNFGASAGIAEMLLQSHLRLPDDRFEIHLLPALPRTWASGSVRGLAARGGATVDIEWEEGRLKRARLQVKNTGPVQLRLGARTARHEVAEGGTLTVNSNLEKQ